MFSEVLPRMVRKTLVPNKERARTQRVGVNKGTPPVISLTASSNALAPSGVLGRSGALAAMINCWMRMGVNKPVRMARSQRRAEVKLYKKRVNQVLRVG